MRNVKYYRWEIMKWVSSFSLLPSLLFHFASNNYYLKQYRTFVYLRTHQGSYTLNEINILCVIFLCYTIDERYETNLSKQGYRNKQPSRKLGIDGLDLCMLCGTFLLLRFEFYLFP